MKLLIVVPCYNEEAVLAETTRRLLSVAGQLTAQGKVDEWLDMLPAWRA